MRDYKDTLNNLFSFHTNDLPNITFNQWKEWAHINGNYYLLIVSIHV